MKTTPVFPILKPPAVWVKSCPRGAICGWTWPDNLHPAAMEVKR